MPVDLPGRRKAGSIGAISFIDERRYRSDEHLHVGVNGFVNLTIKADTLHVEYVDVHGQTVFRERFQATAGSVEAVGSENVALTACHNEPA